ncbi:hypothetical protein BD414DRAFT_497434 [Trametes punicea]|nr:hypothetical protein BD414DRAFT_497434 [Trametes punicea]
MPPSYSPCPRPILKRTSASAPSAPPPQDEPSALLAIDPSILSSLVRFPPQPALAHTLGSALPYDRSPIVVTPNRCALPERGCPGRTYTLDDPSPALRKAKRAGLSPSRGKHLHPRVVSDRDLSDDNDPTPRQSPRVDHFPLPPLIPDLSSESSEESDGIASPPPELYSSSVPHSKMSLEQSLMNLTLAGTNAPSTSALSFLPHPPSPRVRPSTSPTQPSAIPNSYSHSYSAYASNPSLSATSGLYSSHGPTSPVRSRSPASPTRSKRKSRPAPIPIPSSGPGSSSPTAAYPSSTSCSPTPTASYPGAPASPERERRSRHRGDGGERDREPRQVHRDRSRERRGRERAERTPRYKSFSDASCRMSSGGFGLSVEDSGCLGGF